MSAPAWTIWIQRDDMALEALRPALQGLHDANVSIEFFKRTNVTLVRAAGDDWDESSAAAAALARTLRCPVFHLWGAFGSADELAAEGFAVDGALSWSLSSPEEPTGERSRERAYWRVHRALRLPGKQALVYFFAESPLEVAGPGWKKFGVWPTDKEKTNQAQARTRVTEATRKLGGFLARLAATTQGPVVAVLIDHARRELRAATKRSVAALEHKLRHRSVLLRRCPPARVKVWTHRDAFPFAVRLSQDQMFEVTGACGRDFRQVVSAVRQSLGEYVRVGETTTSGIVWWTKLTIPPGRPLLELTPRELIQAIAESASEDSPIRLDLREWGQLMKHMERHLDTFAPMIASLLLEPGGGSSLHLLGLLTLPKARTLADNARYVKTLQQLYKKEPISRIADALRRVGVRPAGDEQGRGSP